MTKTNAEKDLEIRIGSDISQYDNFSLPDRDYANNLTELIDWCSPHDWSKILCPSDCYYIIADDGHPVLPLRKHFKVLRESNLDILLDE